MIVEGLESQAEESRLAVGIKKPLKGFDGKNETNKKALLKGEGLLVSGGGHVQVGGWRWSDSPTRDLTPAV